MRQYALIVFVILISVSCSYDKKYFDFNSTEIKHFSNYAIGDTIYFESNLGDIDTITIMGFGVEVNEISGKFMAPEPINGKWIQIKHLPVDKWSGINYDMDTDGKPTIDYQELFWISKHPVGKTTTYYISYKDFRSNFDTTIGEFHSDTLSLNGKLISNYYKVFHYRPEKVVEPKSIETIYWTDRFGLTAYKSKDGEVWTIKF